jgi:hypothetical protein
MDDSVNQPAPQQAPGADCGCDCEQCSGSNHGMCTTGQCNMNKPAGQPDDAPQVPQDPQGPQAAV